MRAQGDVFYTVPNINQLRQIVTSLDHQMSIKDTLTGRYVYNYYHEPSNEVPLWCLRRSRIEVLPTITWRLITPIFSRRRSVNQAGFLDQSQDG